MSIIEELANKAYLNHWEATKSIPLCGIRNASRFHFNAGFKAGANALMSLPISERMTAEEKERVRKMYKRMVVDVENSDSYDCIPASDMDNVMETLESIFGADFFKGEE